MTIKPIASQKRSAAVADGENNETMSNAGIAVGDTTGSALVQQGRNSTALSQRNVIDPHHAHNKNQASHGDVFDELTRHRHSPHKATRSKRSMVHIAHHHENLKRERERKHAADVHKHTNLSGCGTVATSNCNSSNSCVDSSHSSPSPLTLPAGQSNNPTIQQMTAHGGPTASKNKSPERMLMAKPNTVNQPAAGANAKGNANLPEANEDAYSGYNSGDEHLLPKGCLLSSDEWRRRDEQFAKCMTERGYVLKPVEEDGACLFRSISLQIYGDEEMHDVIRQHTMDYIHKNREYFRHFVTEDINSYIKRKRRKNSHGNHIEIQAMSEIYNRPVEVYCYKPTPINIFNSEQLNNGYAPLRLSYQRGSHYNAIIDPYNATVGVGLGLAGYKPELQTKEAIRLSEQLEIEQTMFEDKLMTTDWEATNEAIEEQIARESYLQWCRENLQKSRKAKAATATVTTTTTATITSATAGCNDPTATSAMSILTANDTTTASSTKGGGIVANSGTAVAVASAVAATANGCKLMDVSMTPRSDKSSAQFDSYELSMSTMQRIDDFKGFDSDDTDMSSTSSLNDTADNSFKKMPSLKIGRIKKQKMNNTINATKSTKKIRRELQNKSGEDSFNSNAADPGADGAGGADGGGRVTRTGRSLLKNVNAKRSLTPPDMEQQQPSTSKQLNTPEKQLDNSTTTTTTTIIITTNTTPTTTTTTTSVTNNGAQQIPVDMPISSFYQELLEASYSSDGYGQLSESEMLQRAIQLSTQDYIDHQKRKYLYGP